MTISRIKLSEILTELKFRVQSMSMIATCVSKAQLVRISCPPRAVLLDLHLEHLVNHEGSYHPWNPFVLLTRGAVGQDIMSTSGRSVGSSPRTSGEPRRQLPPLESICLFDQGHSWSEYHVHLGPFCWIFTSNIW